MYTHPRGHRQLHGGRRERGQFSIKSQQVRVSFKGRGTAPLGYFVPPLEVIGVKILCFTCLWLTGYIDYKNQFLAAPLNVEIAVIDPS